MENNKIKITRADIPHNINADDIVIKTDLGRFSKIVKTNFNTKPSPIIKISKHEYVDTRDGEIKQYDLDKPTSIKDIKKKIRKYEELILFNFAGGRSELFVTLTCSENVQDIQIIKKYFKEFTDKLKAHEIYHEIDYVGIYEQSEERRWHVHAFLKYPNSKVLYIPRNELESLWGKGIVHVFQNLNTIQTLGHSAEKREEKLERLKQFPKGQPMYCRSRGIKTPPKEKIQFQECPEYNSDEYKQLSRKTYLARNVETDKIVNATTTAMYKHVSAQNEITLNSNFNISNHPPTISQSDHDTKVKEMIERQNDPSNKWYYEFI